MARPSPARPPPLDRLNMLEDPLAVGRADARAVVVDRHLDRRAAWASAPTSTGPAVGRVAGGVLQQVGQHLVHEHLVDVDRRQVAGSSTVDGGRVDGQRLAARPRPRRPPGVISRRSSSGAGLDPGHVQEVGHQAVEGVGLVLDQRRAARGGRPSVSSSPASARGCVTAVLTDASGVRRSWETAPIMRVPQPVDLLEQLGSAWPARGAGCARGPGRPGWRTSGAAPTRGRRGRRRPWPPSRPAGRGRSGRPG